MPASWWLLRELPEEKNSTRSCWFSYAYNLRKGPHSPSSMEEKALRVQRSINFRCQKGLISSWLTSSMKIPATSRWWAVTPLSPVKYTGDAMIAEGNHRFLMGKFCEGKVDSRVKVYPGLDYAFIALFIILE